MPVVEMGGVIATILTLIKQDPGKLPWPPELIELVAGMAGNLEYIAESLNGANGNGGGSLPPNVVPNTNAITAFRFQCVAINTGYQLPQCEVPDDMQLLLKGWIGNAGTIYVSETQPGATNLNQVWTLIPNEMVSYRVKNASLIWVSATNAGDYVNVTVEQRK